MIHNQHPHPSHTHLNTHVTTNHHLQVEHSPLQTSGPYPLKDNSQTQQNPLDFTSTSQPTGIGYHNPTSFIQTNTFRPSKLKQINPHKVIDPRTRAKLGLDPQQTSNAIPKGLAHDKNNTHATPWASAHLLPQYPSKAAASSQILDHPTLHSSRLIQLQMKAVSQHMFDPVQAMATVILDAPDDTREIMRRITSKSLNSSLKSTQYSNLVQINNSSNLKKETNENSCNDLHLDSGSIYKSRDHGNIIQTKKIPRAKKAVNKTWLASMDKNPNASDFKPAHLEVDTISLPYPELRDNPFLLPLTNEYVKPVIASMDVNLEDYRLSKLLAKPVWFSDFDLNLHKPQQPDLSSVP
ncbi:expressed protein [Batrachochytrium dendrobatidis JAM81]|uniref:Expressed protein n=2 Tax=Batrachochytrium dendrobatidis TaxID=109871 RepID=F4P9V9_BATDJ|nr:uncharacterized protein BATDEDRAFT_35864 [Batrachochytrium dendrobatidis JAM81]EGF78010.1 expressed protein [Batrachochytrium dendrobatidis JAM81]OAJ44079.1 hypothetical protein BDEG_27357 [Batrachochytrium dendrobatidis JEL423]|eukprot:XP_006681458.1 expressed protein [Batrachochytrium dendrobatidis JAM81]